MGKGWWGEGCVGRGVGEKGVGWVVGRVGRGLGG